MIPVLRPWQLSSMDRSTGQLLWPSSATPSVGSLRFRRIASEIGAVSGRTSPDRVEVRMTPFELDYPGSRNRGPFGGRADSLMSIASCGALGYLRGHAPYRALGQPPGESERRSSRWSKSYPTRSVDETEVVIRLSVDEDVIERRGHGAELLYPDWDGLSGSPLELAQRTEAPLACVVGLVVEALDGVMDWERIATLMQGPS